jgi:hypothetical protein
MGGVGSGGHANSGPKPRPLRERALRNSRVQLPAAVEPFPGPSLPGQDPDEGWCPTDQDLVGLGAAPKALVLGCVHRHVLTAPEGAVLLSAARVLDAAGRWHRHARAASAPNEQARYTRLAIQCERTLAVLLAQLRVTQ